MDESATCFLTGEPATIERDRSGRDVLIVTSQPCGTYELSRTLAAATGRWEVVADRKYLLAAVARQHSEAGRRLQLTTANLEEIAESIRVPKGPLEQIDLFLQLIHADTSFAGKRVQIDVREAYPRIVARNKAELGWVMDRARELGYLQSMNFAAGHSGHNVYEVVLSLKGWQRLDELRKVGRQSNQAFVAMWFTDAMNAVWRDAIRPAIEEAGYEPFRIDMAEHNDQIDDRIVAEIRRSGLLVADFTGHRGGVYFEAGFAMGLGIPVIWMCRADDLDDLHFDTRQYNHIVWTAADDLKEKLTYRILATAPPPGTSV